MIVIASETRRFSDDANNSYASSSYERFSVRVSTAMTAVVKTVSKTALETIKVAMSAEGLSGEVRLCRRTKKM